MKYLYFTSEHCMPCRKIKSEITKYKNIEIIDIDEDDKLVKKYDIQSIPTLLILNNKDQVEKQIVGTSIVKFLEKLSEKIS